jgi:nucleoside-diphosphate-sugar epimerase
MKVLFIGGTGVISTACTELAALRGIDLYLLNRGRTRRALPDSVHTLRGDINDPNVGDLLAEHQWDAVVDWIAYTPEHVQRDIELCSGRVGQYIFISSASVYQTPPSTLPVKESTLLDNPYWDYSRQKIACEERLLQAYRETKFPMTIVRPSHTYDSSKIPLFGGYTTLHRLLQGQKVFVYGDGTSLWTLTHAKDFAKGFVPLLGNSRAIGDVFHITSDEWLNWNQIYEIVAQKLGVKAQMVHVPSDLVAAYDAEIGAGLLGDKSNSMIFDNSKIKRLVPDFACTIPFSHGAQEIVDWYAADPARQEIDEEMNELIDEIIAAHEAAYPVR